MKLNYVSLFSGAGIGCFKLKNIGFECIATVEKEYKRLKFQKINNKCKYENSYICSDLSLEITKQQLYEIVKKLLGKNQLTLLISTPPCQGMSVANHKKKDEKNRNSLVIESIKIINELLPKFFIFENVSSFLNTICFDGKKDIKIGDLIIESLNNEYIIYSKVINFKNYGANSSRTRTLVVGCRKNLNISPINIFPKFTKEKTLYEVIGNFKRLKTMGEIDKNDIFHQYRKYDTKMLNWIKDIKEGQSAFENIEKNKRPHKIYNSVIVENTNKNGDKYRRQFWSKVAPCIHTRNDILSSQNTIHPVDNRVFSIRELMELMNIPIDFKWSEKELNCLDISQKELFLKQNELNIRRCIGEAVPCSIFEEISKQIKVELYKKNLNKSEINDIVKENNINNFIYYNCNNLRFDSISKIVELNNKKDSKIKSTFFTPQNICFDMISSLPDFNNKEIIKILEPSCGIGNFLPQLIKKYQDKKLEIDCIDIDYKNINIARNLFINTNNIKFNFINCDFLLYEPNKEYDIIIGNPPFGNVVKDKYLLKRYKENSKLKTNNIFALFIEKSLKFSKFIYLITPKSILNAPEFSDLRKLLNSKKILIINDYGEKAFNVKIETVSFLIENKKSNYSSKTIICSKNLKTIKKQYYITQNIFDIWLIYRNDYFDSIALKLEFNIFSVFRDRQITKKILKNSGKYRVLKSHNIINNGIKYIPKYDKFIDNIEGLSVSKFLNTNRQIILIPNLTYYPRAALLPNDCIVDGSVAILISDKCIKDKDLDYFSSDEFYRFYKIARNYSTRTLNIDSNSVKFFGILKNI
ncbi:DNA cytosine methyltransferase [Brachyspira aalborgi]|uniref:DNA cytosine methyltransferase n=1 Tax=Brachyspira aalborgi TaxID=29522 RepID=UPI0026657936|nr:DNA cytosine methyltransferase [Brachyspira aalborgi]